MLDHDAMHHIGDVVESVDDLFQVVVNFIADEESQTAAVDIRLVELTQADIMQFVCAAFDRRNLRGQVADTARLGAD